MPQHSRRAWRALVPCVALAAGFLFATSARTARGTDLRSDRRPQLAELISERNAHVARDTATLREIRAKVAAETASRAAVNTDVAAAQRAADSHRPEAGLTAVHGPGLTVSLDDAPRTPDDALPEGAGPDDVVVHQQDVQAVVNALWAGGAESMTIMGQRVVSTSAVRCVGNTLLLQGRVYSPPFVVAAVGNASTMSTALNREPGVSLFREYVDAYHLGYSVKSSSRLSMPAYSGALSLAVASPLPSARASDSPPPSPSSPSPSSTGAPTASPSATASGEPR